jgi:hypothetical protein
MSKVTKLYPKNAADNPDNVLELGVGQFVDVLLLGFDKNGDFDVRSSSGLKHPDLVWLLEHFKFKLLNGDYDERS